MGNMIPTEEVEAVIKELKESIYFDNGVGMLESIVEKYKPKPKLYKG